MGRIFHIRSNVSLVCSTRQCVSPCEYSALVIAELLGDPRMAYKADDANDYLSLLDMLKKIGKRIQRNDYSKDALVHLICEEYLKDLSVDELRSLIHDNSVLEFPASSNEPMKVLKVSEHPPVLRNDYGNEVYSVPIKDIKTDNPKNAKIALSPALPKDNEGEVNRQLENIYESLVSEFGNEPEYEWEFLMSEDKYLTLKQKLAEIPAFPPTSKLSLKASKAIAVYVSEFYKREYDGSLNAFNEIGKKNQSDVIGNIDDMPVYSKINDALLFSLYVDGGLPVNQLMLKLGKDNDALISFLRGLLCKDDFKRSLAFANLPKTSQTLNNTAFKGSLRDGKSIYEQISSIVAGKDVFSAEDTADSNGIYASFLQRIRESEDFNNKFWISFNVYFDQEENYFSIRPLLHLHPELDGERHYALSEARLASWGLSNASGPVAISICTGSEDMPVRMIDEGGKHVDNLVFIPSMNKDYVESCRRDTFMLPELGVDFKWENFWCENYIAEIGDITGRQVDITNFLFKKKKEPYIKLFSRDGYAWQSNKGNRSFPHAAILFDTNLCHPEDGSYIRLNANAGISFFDYSITFLVRKKEITFFNSKGRIVASPKKECRQNFGASAIVFTPEDGLFEYHHANGDSEKVSLIKNTKPSFDVMAAEDNEPINTGCSLYVVGENGDKQPYDGSVLPLGYIKFEITFDERYFASVPCFVLPEGAEIKAESSSNKITFANFSDNLSVTTEKSSVSNGHNKICTIKKKEEEDDFISFEVHSEKDDGHLCIQTYYPINQTIFRTDSGVLIKPAGSTRDAIPVIFSGLCSKTVISDGKTSKTHVVAASAKTYNCMLDTCYGIVDASSEHGRSENNIRFISYSQDFIPKSSEKGRLYEVMRKSDLNQLTCLVEDYLFYFLDFDDLSTTTIQTRIVQENNSNVCILDLSEFKSEGMLFQSLKGEVLTPSYFRPKYVPRHDSTRDRAASAKKSDKMYRICGYSKGDYCSPEAIRSFEIAVEHNMYFSSMDILTSLICEYEDYSSDGSTFKVLEDGNEIAQRIVMFLKSYTEHCKKNGLAIRYDGLWRLAKEFVFNWVYIPKCIFQENGIDMEDIRALFLSNPSVSGEEWGAYCSFVDNYESISVARTHSQEAAEKIKEAVVGPRSMFNKIRVAADGKKTADGGKDKKKKAGKESFAYYRAVFLDNALDESWDKINKSLKTNTQ